MDYDLQGGECEYCGANALKYMQGEYTCTKCCCVSNSRHMVSDNPYTENPSDGHYRCSPMGTTSIINNARLSKVQQWALIPQASRSNALVVKNDIVTRLQDRFPRLVHRTLGLQTAFIEGTNMRGDEAKHASILAACLYKAGIETSSTFSKDQVCDIVGVHKAAFCKAYDMVVEFFNRSVQARSGAPQSTQCDRMTVEAGVQCAQKALGLQYADMFRFKKTCLQLHEKAVAANLNATQRLAQFSMVKVCATLGYMAAKILNLPQKDTVEYCKLARISEATLLKIECLMIELLSPKKK